jgi:ankyrin repeat protein
MTLYIINAGVDINAIGDMGETPLHVAIHQEDLNLIGLLLRNGARTDIRSEFGETAIEAAKNKSKEIWKALRKYIST